MVKRLEGWEKRYSQYLINSKDSPFEWGSNDCFRFALDAVEVITGERQHKDFDDVKTESQCKQLLIDSNGIIGLVTRCLGEPEKNILRASRGDVVALRNNGHMICGLVSDCGQKIIAVSEDGTIRLPLSKAYRVWRY